MKPVEAKNNKLTIVSAPPAKPLPVSEQAKPAHEKAKAMKKLAKMPPSAFEFWAYRS